MENPDMIILDEATTGLDLFAREKLLHQVERIADLPHAPTVLYVTHHAEEITAGEFNEFSCIPKQRFVDGAQAHILAPLGLSPDGKPWNRWCRPGCSYTHGQMRDYIRAVNAAGGTVTVDIRIDRSGRFDPAQVACMTMTDL